MGQITNIQASSVPSLNDIPVYNYSSSVQINAGEAVSVDATNTVGGIAPPNEGVGVIKTAVSGNPSIGVAMENIPPLTMGRVRTAGPVAQSIADGAITAGTWVDASAAASRGVVAHTATHSAVGIALETAVDGDQIAVVLALCANA